MYVERLTRTRTYVRPGRGARPGRTRNPRSDVTGIPGIPGPSGPGCWSSGRGQQKTVFFHVPMPCVSRYRDWPFFRVKQRLSLASRMMIFTFTVLPHLLVTRTT